MWLCSPEFVCGYLIKYSLFLWISCVMCFIAAITWQTNCYCYLHTHKYTPMESLNNLRGLFRIPSEEKVCVLFAFLNLQVSTRGTWGCRSADGLSHTSQPILSARDNHRHQRWAHSSSQIRSQHWSETRTGRMPTCTLINTTFLTIIWQTTVKVNVG